MADYLPKHAPGQAITVTAATNVTGGRLVAVTGAGMVSPAGANAAAVLGVAAFDAETGDTVTVYRGGVQRLVAADTIAAGAQVAAGADGTVSATGSNRIGIALTAAADPGAVVEVAGLGL